MHSWLDRSIYFILIDRFQNGDPTNDDFGRGEFDPQDENCFHGGDLRGVSRRLEHIKDLGFDAIWITPPVHNQWINPYIPVKGYHGYWAYDFTKVDPHFGTLDDYKAMVAKAHELGIKVIQDIVVNHTGNYFTVDEKGYDPKLPEKNWKGHENAYPPENSPKAPNDPIFTLNNPNIPEHKKAAVYNFTPNISDYKSRRQTLTWTMGDLDDINLLSPLAARRMREIYRYWIEAVGIDGFRIDTVYYTPEKFYEDFLHKAAPKDRGVKRFAVAKGIKDFFVFGEVWSYDYKAVNRYVRSGASKRLDAAIDHPLSEALIQVFFRKLATNKLAQPLRAVRANRGLWVNFLDNHDAERISSLGDWQSARQALAALFILPGIPCVTYGTEAGFKGSRQDMFDDAAFDLGRPEAQWIKKMIAFRKAHPEFSQGDCSVVASSESCGILALETRFKAKRFLTVFNTAPDRMAFSCPGSEREVLMQIPALSKEAGVWILEPGAILCIELAAIASPSKLRLTALKKGPTSGRIALTCSGARLGENLFLLVDGNFSRKIPLSIVTGGQIEFDTTHVDNGLHALSVLGQSLSNEIKLEVANPYRRLARVAPTGKAGMDGAMRVPAEASYGKQMSIKRVDVLTSGRDLRLELSMEDVTSDWNPPNGYDHVYFSVFFDFPDKPGKNFFPKMNYSRSDFNFNVGFLLHGWAVRSWGADDSTPTVYGSPLIGGVATAVNRGKKTISFTFASRLFGGRDDFAGVKIFIATWDGYLGEYRGISDKKEDWNFYTISHAEADPPKIYDHALISL